jgi:alkylresorcinol/alkylpyrone synthase
MASTLLAVRTALPEHVLDAAARGILLQAIWPHLKRMGSAAEDGGGARYLVVPPEQLMTRRGLGETMEIYAAEATHLAEVATRRVLDAAGLRADEIDVVVSVSCTGYMIPSMDVYLAEHLGLRPNVVRLPITQLGCSGGAAALGFAHRHLVAFPWQRVLVIAVELPSLTFQPDDSSRDNLTAAMVFGDGAAAAILTGSDVAPHGLQLLTVASQLIQASTKFLGYDLRSDGFHIVLDRRLPQLIETKLGEVVRNFLEKAEMDKIDFLAAHGGGPRILDGVQRALRLEDALLAPSRETFDQVGNVSSASLLFTLKTLMESLGDIASDGLGIGLGPGVSIELLQLGWRP